MENIKRITETLQKGEYISNPHQCASDLAVLSGEYSFLCGSLEDIIQRKAGIWNEIRKTTKSDTATERVYEQTKDGIDELGLRLRMKRCEKMMSALKALITLANNEVHNLH